MTAQRARPRRHLKSGVSIGRVAGIPVTLDWSLLFIFGLLTVMLAVSALPALAEHSSPVARWPGAVIGAALFLASLLAHELSHSLMARRHGVGVRDIRLWLLGGISTLEGDPPTARADFQISVVGPLTSAALGALFVGFAAVLYAIGGHGVPFVTAVWLGSINLVLAVFNLLPGAPLDGGRVLRAYLWRRWGDRRRAALSAARAGKALGWGLVALGFLELLAGGDVGGLWLMLIGWFVTNAANAEAMQTIVAFDLAGVRVRDVMTRDPVCAPWTVTVAGLLDEYVFAYRHSSFPLVDDDGRVRALATLSRLKEVPAAQRATTPASTVAWPIGIVEIAAPDDLLLAVLQRSTGTADGRVLVFETGRLAGIVSPTDVTRTLQLAEARGGAPLRDAA